jgi:hypothetical protein
MEATNEVWRVCGRFPDYEVSSRKRLRVKVRLMAHPWCPGRLRKVHEKIIRQDRWGYVTVRLDKKYYTAKVDTLFREAFPED